MRIAVCFSGQIRTGIECAPNILRYIGDLLPNCDFFVHTWDVETVSQNTNRNSAIAPNVPFPVDPRVFAVFHTIYQPITMTVDRYHSRATEDRMGGARIDPVTGRKLVAWLESIYEVNLMKKQYEQKNNFTYDYVIRIRPDIIFCEDKSLQDDLALVTDNQMFLTGEYMTVNRQDRLEDIFWIAQSSVMDQLAEFYSVRADANWEQYDFRVTPNYLHTQEHMSQWVHSLGLTYRPLNNNKLRIYWRCDLEDGMDPMTTQGDPRRGV